MRWSKNRVAAVKKNVSKKTNKKNSKTEKNKENERVNKPQESSAQVLDNTSDGRELAHGESEVRALVQTSRGPLPSAQEFDSYEKSLPGAGDRILSMAEKTSEHSQAWEKKALDAQVQIECRGQN